MMVGCERCGIGKVVTDEVDKVVRCDEPTEDTKRANCSGVMCPLEPQLVRLLSYQGVDTTKQPEVEHHLKQRNMNIAWSHGAKSQYSHKRTLAELVQRVNVDREARRLGPRTLDQYYAILGELEGSASLASSIDTGYLAAVLDEYDQAELTAVLRWRFSSLGYRIFDAIRTKNGRTDDVVMAVRDTIRFTQRMLPHNGVRWQAMADAYYQRLVVRATGASSLSCQIDDLGSLIRRRKAIQAEELAIKDLQVFWEDALRAEFLTADDRGLGLYWRTMNQLQEDGRWRLIPYMKHPVSSNMSRRYIHLNAYEDPRFYWLVGEGRHYEKCERLMGKKHNVIATEGQYSSGLNAHMRRFVHCPYKEWVPSCAVCQAYAKPKRIIGQPCMSLHECPSCRLHFPDVRLSADQEYKYLLTRHWQPLLEKAAGSGHIQLHHRVGREVANIIFAEGDYARHRRYPGAVFIVDQVKPDGAMMLKGCDDDLCGQGRSCNFTEPGRERTPWRGKGHRKGGHDDRQDGRDGAAVHCLYGCRVSDVRWLQGLAQSA